LLQVFATRTPLHNKTQENLSALGDSVVTLVQDNGGGDCPYPRYP
jgi:hypothetical protein